MSTDFIIFSLGEVVFLQEMIDNENGSVTTMYVNGQEGIFVEYSDVLGWVTLVRQDSSYQYVMSGDFELNTDLLKIVEEIDIE